MNNEQNLLRSAGIEWQEGETTSVGFVDHPVSSDHRKMINFRMIARFSPVCANGFRSQLKKMLIRSNEEWVETTTEFSSRLAVLRKTIRLESGLNHFVLSGLKDRLNVTRALDTKNIVTRFCNQLAGRLGPTKFGLWFEETATIQFQADGSLRINVPTQFHADWIERNFRGEIDDLAHELLENKAAVALEVTNGSGGAAAASRATPPVDRPRNSLSASTRTSATPFNGSSGAAEVNDRNGRYSPDTEGHADSLPAPQPISIRAHDALAPREQASALPGHWRRTTPEQHRGQPATSQQEQSAHHRLVRSRSRSRSAGSFDERYDLARFVTGQGNDLAFHAAQRLAQNDAAFSPLCLHGGCGLGKTHLLHGICRQYRASFPAAQIRYVTGENFTNEFIAAVRANKLEQFRKKIRQLDLLAIDDVHFLSNKNATQKEFLCTLDAIGLSNARIVLASDNHPRFINDFHQRLVSRLVSGMVVEVRMPERETRVRIIRQIALQRGLRINGAAIDTLADRCIGSIREIEGTLTRLNAMHELLYRSEASGQIPEIGLILVNKVLESQSALPSRPIPVSQIVDEVARRCGVTNEQVLGRSRHKRVVLARSLAAYLARQLTTKSYPEIARALAKKNHSTMIAADRRIKKLVDTDERVDLGLDEVNVSIRYAVDTLRSAIIANRNHQ